MNRYSLSTERLLSLIPTAMRGANLVWLMRRLLTPLSYVHMLFTTYRVKKEYRLAHSSQVFSLKQVVCDFCGDSGCYITDGEYITEVMIPYDGGGELANYQVAVPYDSGVTPAVAVPYSGMDQTAQNDFLVHLPQDMYGTVNESALRTVINEYKLAGKMFGIVYDDVTIQTYSFAWTNPVCALYEPAATATFTFAWSDHVCVLTGVYTFAWSSGVCVKREIEEPYTFAWSNGVCAKTQSSESYSFAWSRGVCVKTIVEDTTDI